MLFRFINSKDFSLLSFLILTLSFPAHRIDRSQLPHGVSALHKRRTPSMIHSNNSCRSFPGNPGHGGSHRGRDSHNGRIYNPDVADTIPVQSALPYHRIIIPPGRIPVYSPCGTYLSHKNHRDRRCRPPQRPAVHDSRPKARSSPVPLPSEFPPDFQNNGYIRNCRFGYPDTIRRTDPSGSGHIAPASANRTRSRALRHIHPGYASPARPPPRPPGNVPFP